MMNPPDKLTPGELCGTFCTFAEGLKPQVNVSSTLDLTHS